MPWRILAAAALLLSICLPCPAGGPAFVAGSGYDPGVKGQPLIWAQGNVVYYTDQGDLSPILNNSQADAFVAAAFAPWTSLPYVALAATPGGHLAEDVNGSNVSCDPQGDCTMPSDIQPTALTTPVGIVYDYDGTVTDAFLGAGAGDAGNCFSNAVYGGPDNFSTPGNIVHALVVINGVCAASSSQLPDVQYRLERTLARVLGLGWSQANLNVQTLGPPPPGNDDFEGFPLMHYYDSIACVPISLCYPDAGVPKLDDRAALGRLYPVTADNQGGFPGKQVFGQQTARIHGSVYFTDASGNPLQPMQGVNVVARWIASNGQPSRLYVATSVSGFAFRGNAGNTINGFVDAHGLRYDRFGSDDPALEGFFDLAGLEIPDGSNSAQYELSVEAVDANWSEGVGPYAPSQVAPSGGFSPVTITVQLGADVAQDIWMQHSELVSPHPGSGATYANPAKLPAGGGWASWMSGYGNADWFQFTAQANRTASVAVTALDEKGQPTETKLAPVIGMWPLSDQSGDPAPAATPSAFNTGIPGMSRLDAQFTGSGNFRLGVADFRGDGRPDYSYVARLLYSDTVTPARLGIQGGPVYLDGIGFHPGLQVTAAGNNGSVLSAQANGLVAALPAKTLDGTAWIVVTDPASGAFSQMQDALTYGAAASDLLLLLQRHGAAHARKCAGGQSHSCAGGGRRWSDPGERSHHCLEREQRHAALRLQRGIELFGAERRVGRSVHHGDSHDDRAEHDHGPVSAGLVPIPVEAAGHFDCDLINPGSGCRPAHAVGWAGRHARRPADRAGARLGSAAGRRAGELQAGKGRRDAIGGKRNDQQFGIRDHQRAPRQSQCRRAGDGLCRPRQCTVPDLHHVCHTDGALETGIGERNGAGGARGTALPAPGPAGNGWCAGRRSGAGGERRAPSHAGPAQSRCWRRWRRRRRQLRRGERAAGDSGIVPGAAGH